MRAALTDGSVVRITERLYLTSPRGGGEVVLSAVIAADGSIIPAFRVQYVF